MIVIWFDFINIFADIPTNLVYFLGGLYLLFKKLTVQKADNVWLLFLPHTFKLVFYFFKPKYIDLKFGVGEGEISCVLQLGLLLTELNPSSGFVAS